MNKVLQPLFFFICLAVTISGQATEKNRLNLGYQYVYWKQNANLVNSHFLGSEKKQEGSLLGPSFSYSFYGEDSFYFKMMGQTAQGKTSLSLSNNERVPLDERSLAEGKLNAEIYQSEIQLGRSFSGILPLTLITPYFAMGYFYQKGEAKNVHLDYSSPFKKFAEDFYMVSTYLYVGPGVIFDHIINKKMNVIVDAGILATLRNRTGATLDDVGRVDKQGTSLRLRLMPTIAYHVSKEGDLYLAPLYERHVSSGGEISGKEENHYFSMQTGLIYRF